MFEREWESLLTRQRWDHSEASQNLQRREIPLQQQNLGCSRLAEAEAVETGHPETPSSTQKKNKKTEKENKKHRIQNNRDKNYRKSTIFILFCTTSLNKDLVYSTHALCIWTTSIPLKLSDKKKEEKHSAFLSYDNSTQLCGLNLQILWELLHNKSG